MLFFYFTEQIDVYMIRGVYAFVILCGMCACSGGKYHPVLSDAEKYLTEALDSALIILEGIQGEELNRADRAFYALLYVRLQDKKGIDITSDSLLQQAFEYYNRQNEPLQLAYCWYYRGIYYLNVRMDENALEAFLLAKENAELAGEKDLLGLIYSSLSGMYRKQCYADKAIEAASKAICSFRQSGNRKNENLLLLNMGGLFLCDHNLDSCFHYLKRAEAMALERQDTSLLAQLNSDFGCAYLQKGDLNEAKKYTLKTFGLLQNCVPEESYVILSEIYYRENKLDSARLCLYKVLDGSYYSKTTTGLYLRLGKIEDKAGNHEKAVEYFQKANFMLDSLYKKYRKNPVPELTDKFHYEQKRKEALELEIKNTGKVYYIIVLVIGLLVLVGVVYFLVGKRQKEKRTFLLYQVSLGRKLAQQKAMLSELGERDQKLKSLLQKRVEIIKRIIGATTIQGQPVVDYHKVVMDILAFDNWEEFKDTVNILYDGFVDYLERNYPLLTETDLKLCCLVGIGLSTKEIASYLQVNETSVHNRRYEIAKKVKIRFKDFIEQVKRRMKDAPGFEC